MSTVAPKFLGSRAFNEFDLNILVEYIDWKPLFDVWQLRGKYPNRGYPRIFDDKDVGHEAKKLFKDAQKMLHKLIDENILKGSAVLSFTECCAEGDDILLFDSESKQHCATLYGLRQQCDKEYGEECLCLSDFFMKRDSLNDGKFDYIGMFACTAGIGAKEYCDVLEKENMDDYSSIMVKALADRLSEAMAEYLHMKVRTELWGYSTEESGMCVKDLLSIKYEGIRPAPGYPTQPDHTEKRTMWNLMDAEKLCGIKLTETYAMEPAASVCGLYIAHPDSKYFAVGKINKDQVEDYARRKGESVETVEYWLAPILGYDHDQ
ncbi:unnamed protein product [Anisakis simplex]|uniref:AdoMet activation domain-containing protein n=1 Tax=Anisakis simplex TaxID=6269 RepID=A0A0M3J5Z7_ANISI|nr:unnamed protein product [Anisakis simplex]